MTTNPTSNWAVHYLELLNGTKIIHGITAQKDRLIKPVRTGAPYILIENIHGESTIVNMGKESFDLRWDFYDESPAWPWFRDPQHRG